MKSAQFQILSGSTLTLILATLLIAFTGLKSESSFGVTVIPDLNEIAYYEMLKEQGIESKKALAQGEDCGPRSEMSHKVGIIGQDRRRRLSAQEEQDYSGVVGIHSEKGDADGSGFLVCDGSVVLTNAHNFYDVNGKLRANFSAYKAYLSNKAGDFQPMEFDTRPEARVVGGTTNLREFRDQDWILIRLKNRPNTRNFKPLKVRSQPEVLEVSNQPTSGIETVGFLNGDNWNKYSSPCTNFRSASSVWEFSSFSARVYSHDCSTEGGASGSPIIQGTCQGSPQAIALHSGGHSELRKSFNNSQPFENNFATPISQDVIDGMRKLCGDSFRTAVCPPEGRVARH